MQKIIFFVFIAVVLSSCGDGGAAALHEKITNKEDSIATLTKNLQPGEVLSPAVNTELIDLLSEYYHAFPDDAYAPECLDKLHMMYSGMGDYEMSANYADILLNKYPDYINRAMILESQASTYDMYIQPRDTSKVRHYYEMLLSEFPDLEKEKRDGIKSRLDNMHLTIEQIIMQSY